MAAPLLQNEHEMEMEMDPVALMRGDGPEERWEAISDDFFSRVYEYFHERGLRCILASRIISLLSLAFTIALTVFLFELLNLEGLVPRRRDEEWVREPSRRAGGAADGARLAMLSPAVRAADLLVDGYWLWTLRHFVKDLRPLVEMRDFYRDRLQIDGDALHNIAWDAVVQRIVELNFFHATAAVHREGAADAARHRQPHPAQGVLMVAFVNRDLFWWPPPLSRFDFLTKTSSGTSTSASSTRCSTATSRCAARSRRTSASAASSSTSWSSARSTRWRSRSSPS